MNNHMFVGEYHIISFQPMENNKKEWYNTDVYIDVLLFAEKLKHITN